MWIRCYLGPLVKPGLGCYYLHAYASVEVVGTKEMEHREMPLAVDGKDLKSAKEPEVYTADVGSCWSRSWMAEQE